MGGLLFVGDGLPGMLLYGLGCLVSIFQNVKIIWVVSLRIEGQKEPTDDRKQIERFDCLIV